MIRCIEAGSEGLVVHWERGGETTRFPYLWLRDNCACERCRDPRNGQRLFDALDLPAEPRPAQALLTQGEVAIRWAAPDAHDSRYAAGWLAANDLAPAARAARQPKPRYWGAAIANDLPQADWPGVLGDEKAELRLLEALAAHGFALLHRVPVEAGQVAAVGDRLGHVRVTNYGRLFDVVSLPNPNNLAYTAVGLGVHTDNPYRDPTPGLQLLHCLEAGAPGGDTQLVDGFRAAEELRRRHREDFATLARLPLPFRFADAATDLLAATPIISTDFEGRVTAVHFNNRSMAPLDLPEEEILPWYRAYRCFAAILREPAGELRLRLEPGDLLIMENNRALHGRTAFDPNLGRRHLQGCYVDKDGVESRRRVLRRRAA
jgi:gamma-butyrobetaine dioxygenase